MSFIERFKETVTGRTKEERDKDRLEEKKIREEVMRAYKEENRKARIDYAREKAKYEMKQRMLNLKKSKGESSLFGSRPMADPFGNVIRSKPRVKRLKPKRKKINYSMPYKESRPARFDAMSGRWI